MPANKETAGLTSWPGHTGPGLVQQSKRFFKRPGADERVGLGWVDRHTGAKRPFSQS